MYHVSVNTLGEKKDYLCNATMNYNYDETLYNMVANENEDKWNCSVPFHAPTTSKITGKLIEICNNSFLGLQAYNNWDDVLRRGSQIPNYQPCAWMDVVLGLPIVSPDQNMNEAFVRFYFKSHVKVKSIIAYYDFASLVADLGGYIGMLLGVSLIDLTIKLNNLLVRVLAAKLTSTYPECPE